MTAESGGASSTSGRGPRVAQRTWPGLLLAVASGAVTSGLGYVVWYAALRHFCRGPRRNGAAVRAGHCCPVRGWCCLRSRSRCASCSPRQQRLGGSRSCLRAVALCNAARIEVRVPEHAAELGGADAVGIRRRRCDLNHGSALPQVPRTTGAHPAGVDVIDTPPVHRQRSARSRRSSQGVNHERSSLVCHIAQACAPRLACQSS